jgi:hypothetical protein
MRSQIEVRREVAARLKAAREAAGFATAEDFCKAHDLPIAQYVGHEDAKTRFKSHEIC